MLPVSTEALSCVAWVHQRTGTAPLVNAIFYPSFVRTIPSVGTIAMFKYGETVDDYHVAYTEEIRDLGFWISECNFSAKDKCGWRFIRWNDPHLIGFFQPPIRRGTYLALSQPQVIGMNNTLLGQNYHSDHASSSGIALLTSPLP